MKTKLFRIKKVYITICRPFNNFWCAGEYAKITLSDDPEADVKENRELVAASLLFNERTFYAQFRQGLERARKEIVIESPFMTSSRVRSLLPNLHGALDRGVEITVNTREPEEHEGFLRLEAEWAVRTLQAIGVRILFTGGHHRKLAILDRMILWEGSHNILSQNNSCEIMRRIESSTLAQQMIEYIQLSEFL